MSLINLLLVGCGGFAGSVLRYLVSTRVQQAIGAGFPWGTLAVNVIGCILIGFVGGLLAARAFHPSAGLLLITGTLGGFTTFSAFGLETFTLINAGRPLTALAYVMVSVLAGVAAVWLGRIPFSS